MKRETELKFRLRKLPRKIKNGVSIKQLYLKIDTVDTQKSLLQYFPLDRLDWTTIIEARLRIINNSQNILALKGEGTISRDEYEVEISKDESNGLLNNIVVIGEIEKKRYRLKDDNSGLIFEIDVYAGKLAGLIIAEVEYDPIHIPDKEDIIILAKAKLGDEIVDVTEDRRYKNRNLATSNNVWELK